MKTQAFDVYFSFLTLSVLENIRTCIVSNSLFSRLLISFAPNRLDLTRKVLLKNHNIAIRCLSTHHLVVTLRKCSHLFLHLFDHFFRLFCPRLPLLIFGPYGILDGLRQNKNICVFYFPIFRERTKRTCQHQMPRVKSPFLPWSLQVFRGIIAGGKNKEPDRVFLLFFLFSFCVVRIRFLSDHTYDTIQYVHACSYCLRKTPCKATPPPSSANSCRPTGKNSGAVTYHSPRILWKLEMSRLRKTVLGLGRLCVTVVSCFYSDFLVDQKPINHITDRRTDR